MPYETATVDPGQNPSVPVAVDLVGGQDIQIVKLDVGSDGASTPLGSLTNGLPVDLKTLAPGAATAANQSTIATNQVTMAGKQDTGNTSLASIDSKIPAKGQATAANSAPVVLASDQSAVPVSNASLPLPAGASVASKQPALGTAGTPSADVITVQGAASMTPMKIDGSATTQPISAAALPLPAGAATEATVAAISTKTPALGQAVAANSSPVVLASDKNVQLGGLDVNGTPTSVRTDVFGRMKISHGQPTPTTGAIDAVNSQIAINSDGFSDAVFTFVPLGSHIITFEYSPDSTTGSDGTWFPALASNQGASAAAATTATLTTVASSFRVSAPAASWIRARVSTQTTGGSIAAQAITTTAAAQPQVTSTLSSAAVTLVSTTVAAPAATIASVLNAKVVSAAGTNATLIKATAAKVMGWQLANTTAAWKFVKLFVKATAPTPGTDTPTQTIPIPPNASVNMAPVMAQTHGTGIGYSITGAYGDLDTTVVAAGDVVGTIYYV